MLQGNTLVPFYYYKGLPFFPSNKGQRRQAGRRPRAALCHGRGSSRAKPLAWQRHEVAEAGALERGGNAGPPGARACAGTRRRGRDGPTPLAVLERRRCERRPWPLAWPLPVMNLSSRCEAPAWMAAFRAAASPPTASQAGVMVCSLRRRPASASARQWHAAKRTQARAPDVEKAQPPYIYK